MNNKGFALLGGETFKLLIALLCIILLISLGAKLFLIFDQKNKLKIAQGNLDEILIKISVLESKGGGDIEYLLLSPNKWALAGWPNELLPALRSLMGPSNAPDDVLLEYADVDIPKTCSKNKWDRCICICDGIFNNKEMALSSCDDNGICKDATKYDSLKVGDKGVVKISKGGISINIKLENNNLKIIENEI